MAALEKLPVIAATAVKPFPKKVKDELFHPGHMNNSTCGFKSGAEQWLATFI